MFDRVVINTPLIRVILKEINVTVTAFPSRVITKHQHIGIGLTNNTVKYLNT